jgi:hypothetical protein
VVALRLELVGERVRLLAGGDGDPDLPGSEAVVELFVLPRLARRFVVPAILALEPVLDGGCARLVAEAPELRLDDGLARSASAREDA